MSPVEVARLDYELVSDQLQRALGRGGAPVDLPRARDELRATEVALRRLAEVIENELGTR